MYEVIARLTIREGKQEGFKRQAAEMMRQSREKDTKTLRYDWFVSADGTRCEVHEAYADADGLLEHHYNIADAKMILFHEFATDHDMTLFGEPSAALAEAMRGMANHVAFHQYALLDGLVTE
jgi:quinol monooxygenase YgiN